MKLVDPVAGVIFPDSLSAAKAVAKIWMINKRWGDSPFLARRRRRTVVPSFHYSRAAVSAALYGNVSPAVAESQILVSSSSGAVSRRPRRRALVLAKVVVLPLRCLCAAAGLVLRGSRVEEPLDSLRHQAALFALEVVQLVRRRLGGLNVLHRCGVHTAICPEQVGDGHAALLDRT